MFDQSTSTTVCVAVFSIAAGIAIFGFYQMIKRDSGAENDAQVIQRQFRGLAYVGIASVMMILGSLVCVKNDGLRKLWNVITY
jgi:hypothetical protein